MNRVEDMLRDALHEFADAEVAKVNKPFGQTVAGKSMLKRHKAAEREVQEWSDPQRWVTMRLRKRRRSQRLFSSGSAPFTITS